MTEDDGSNDLGERVVQLTGGDIKPTLSHCLLASLRVKKVVTTNYDALYERAFESAHGENSVAVLPREEARAGVPWVLKLHGDVADASSIVLSRRDFVRYDAERRPLGSIVQSLMATGHLIVVGASMTDDNVLRLAHEVLALDARNKRPRTLGTVITLQRDEIRTALWKNDFDYVAVSDSLDQQVAARDLEIFLDKLAILTSVDAPYLLDTHYKGLLEGGEIGLAENLRAAADVIRSLPHEHRERWSSLEAVFDELGATPWSQSIKEGQRVSQSRSQRR
ncbi:SIR2 family protein [Rhodococcus erythropolis]|uniref:SIR2 family NAD-dependent protein deacylase n=1 Tax=Rhodococcus erythropolis TaxID=1833 RepID=UPI001C9A2EFF|nr:SIR2 family protein [Rhodococcus erythropolis]MBY6387764.1 SIR2 family protein [Rhodococcus erythropolis]